MKQTQFCTALYSAAIILLISVSGCVCPPGYFNGACAPGMPLGCGSLMYQGVVDYVDGESGADCGTNCGPIAAPIAGPVVGSACVPHGMTNCGSCLGLIGDGVRVIGDGALSLAASPFILLGSFVAGGCGYESFPNCGCSNEVYYGDNCYQQHDFNDPCGMGCGSYGGAFGGGISPASSGCATCGRGVTEGIQYKESVIPTQMESTDGVLETQPTPTQPTPIQTTKQSPGFRPVVQTSYQQPIRNPVQRVTPPRPVFMPNTYLKKPLPPR